MDHNNPPLRHEELGELVAALVHGLRSRSGDAGIGNRGPHDDRVAIERRRRDEQALRRDAEQRRARIVAATLGKVIPPKVFELITANPYATDAATAALDWWDAGNPRVLVLRGGMGVGKTVAAGLVAKHAVENGKRSLSWHRPNDFVSGMLHAYDADAPEVGRDLVVLDDMGRETKTDFQEALTTFLDNRSARMIITTNDPLPQWRARYDPRLMERLAAEGEAFSVAGASRRQKGLGF